MELLKHKDNREEYTYYLKDGKRIYHGLYREWYDNSQLESKRNYKDGKFHGLCREWYNNGQLWYEYNRRRGIFSKQSLVKESDRE